MSSEELYNEEKQVMLALNDIQFFTPLYEHTVQKVFKYCYYHTFNKTTAEDITSEVFTRAIDMFVRKKYTYNKEVGILGYLYTIARNCIIDDRKKTNKAPKGIEEHQEMPSQDHHDINEEMDKNINIAKIRDVLKKMDDVVQSIFFLKFYEDHTFDQIGVALNMKPSAVKMRYYRTIDQIKQESSI